MKTTKLIGLIALFAMLFSLNVNAQEAATKKEYKEIQKREKTLTKDLKKKAIKDARKEAKRLTKEGYKVPAGRLPLDKQLEDSWVKQYEVDADNYPIYYIATQKATAGSFSAASVQAYNLAKTDLAGQIQTKISQMVESQVSNSELGQDEAASVVNVVSASKSIVSATLGRTIPLVEIYKVLPNSNVEVMVSLAYNSRMATKAALQAIRDNIAKDSAELAAKLDKLAQ